MPRPPPLPLCLALSLVAAGFYALHGDFGSLTTDNLATNAIPWKLINALPDVVPEPFFADGYHGWQPFGGEPLRRFGLSV